MEFYCISLETRTDRQEHMKKLFKKLNLNVTFRIVQKHPVSGIYGCFESHYFTWIDENIKSDYICVFEDDLDLFHKKSAKRFNRLIQYVKEHGTSFINLEPGAGYYGSESIFFSKHSSDELRDGFTTRTGCYIANVKYMRSIALKIRKSYGIDIDVALYGNCDMWSVVVPIFRQNKDLGTDNTGQYHDYLPHPNNSGLEYTRNFLTCVPLFAKIYLNGFQAGCNLLTYGADKNVEFIDRRIFS